MKNANPWLCKWEKDKDKVADIDKEWLNKYKGKNLLQLVEYPEPFIGDVASKVYLLSGNPGQGAYTDDKNITDSTKFRTNEIQSIEDCLSLKAKDFYYFNKNNSTRKGYNWWIERTNELIAEFNGIKKQKLHSDKNGYIDLPTEYKHLPSIFNIEYFPYHSNKLNSIRNIKDLPSFKFTDEIINEGIDKNKLFIILRMKREWFNRIPKLEEYAQKTGMVYVLSNARSIYLTPKNILPYNNSSSGNDDIWNKLINQLK